MNVQRVAVTENFNGGNRKYPGDDSGNADKISMDPPKEYVIVRELTPKLG